MAQVGRDRSLGVGGELFELPILLGQQARLHLRFFGSLFATCHLQQGVARCSFVMQHIPENATVTGLFYLVDAQEWAESLEALL